MMEPVRQVEGIVAPLDRVDVDTDQIIPKQFLTRIERTGYGEFLFHDWRREGGFVLDRAPYDSARILVAGRNFGCGSSREHAAWALQQWGLGAVVSTGLADIFRSNCIQTGLVPVELADAEVRHLLDAALEAPGYMARVDVAEGRLTGADGFVVEFALRPAERRALLEGLDPIARTLALEDRIRRYEEAHPVPEAWREG